MDDLFDKLLAEDIRDLLKKFPDGLDRLEIADQLKLHDVPLPPMLELAMKLKNHGAIDTYIGNALHILWMADEITSPRGFAVQLKPALDRLAGI